MRPPVLSIAAFLAGALLLGSCADSSGPGGTERVRYRSVAAGFNHTCALSTTEKLYCWGGAPFVNDSIPHEIPLPEPISDITSASSIFGYSSCGWTTAGTIYCWGGWTPAIDIGVNYGNGRDPITIAGAGPLTNLAASTSHGCGLRTDSTAACWGSFVFGRRGLLIPQDTAYASLVASQIGSDIKYQLLSVGYSSTCGVQLDGQVSCWGDSIMLGSGAGIYLRNENPCFYQDFACRIAPIAVPGVTGATSLSNGGEQVCALGSLGVSCWGVTLAGVKQVSVPMPLVSVAVGLQFACGLGVDGKAYCWGDLSFGGWDPSADDPPTAFAVAGERFTQVSVGRQHACGLVEDGRLYCWGATTAALGNGKGEIADQPTRVAEPR